ncbi:DUF2948 family protein [Tundrisphaera sp. TA3]|uniref:DUF2948 family protein n=1 Tax=Tundrisphaera sp. TA3 TaxID=3435775 RepID=UPI003EB6F46D
MLPNFSDFFRRDQVKPLRFKVRGLANHAHDIQYLSSYLHDARFEHTEVVRRGKRLTIVVQRDCWELGLTKHSKSSELHIARSRLTISPVSEVRWELEEPSCLGQELWIERLYLGEAHWETDDASEIFISAPHGGWKMRITIAEEFGNIRLTDLETPYLYSSRNS